MTSPTREARIDIIGAGPAGLTCARILQRHGITVTVHDRDPGPDTRDQGGSLDLHADSGQLALREAGLLDEFLRLSRPEGQEMRILGADGEPRARIVPEEGELLKPEIDRSRLRDLLLDSLSPGTVRWGQALTHVSGPAGGPRTLHFADRTIVETDLVIGADGAFSRVRPAVSPAGPQYTGVSFTEAWFHAVDDRHPELSALVGPGSATGADGRRALWGQRNSGDHIRVYIIRKVPADWITAAGLRPDDTAGIRAHLLGEFVDWSPRMRRMISDNDGRYVNRPIFALPVPHVWDHDPTVTLLGDAAHLMPPLGIGVNLAMLDAADLALALAGSANIGEAVRAYEDTMLPRSTETAKLLEGRVEDLLSDDLPPEFSDDHGAGGHSGAGLHR